MQGKGEEKDPGCQCLAAVFRFLRKCAGNPVPTVRPRTYGLYGQYPLGKPGVRGISLDNL